MAEQGNGSAAAAAASDSVPAEREAIASSGPPVEPTAAGAAAASSSGEVTAETPKQQAAIFNIHAEVDRLQKEQAELKKERKRVASALKNAQRKKQRLKSRAKQLSDEELLAVIQLRRDEKSKKASGGVTEPTASTDVGEGNLSASEMSSQPTTPTGSAVSAMASNQAALTPDRMNQVG